MVPEARKVDFHRGGSSTDALELGDYEHQMTVLARACYICAQSGWTVGRPGVREKCQIRHFGLLTPRRGGPYNPPIAEDRGGGNDAKD